METQQKRPVGRPSTITPEVIAKLEQVFAMDGTVEEALSYAEIKPNAYYDYLNAHPEFSQRITDLRQRPLLKARQTIIKSLDNPKDAQWYVERKRKKEFAQRTELTGLDGEPIKIAFDKIFENGSSSITSEATGDSQEPSEI